MTKNVKGGNSHKKQARKNNGPPIGIKKLRVSQNECEAYAIVTKLLGNSMCYVADTTNNELLCIIRGKFRGKEKLEVGTWVLVGDRSWETEKKDVKPKCDLLEIYSKDEMDRLNKIIKHSWKNTDSTNSDDTTAFEYDSNIDQLPQFTKSDRVNTDNNPGKLNNDCGIITLNDEEIDFDFI
jgi:translation initiation factor IF-1